MRAGVCLSTSLVLGLAAGTARAEKLLAVLPLDVREADGKLDAGARSSLEQVLRSEAVAALGPSGWSVLGNEKQFGLLLTRGADPAQCADLQCQLTIARALKSDLFVSCAIQRLDGEFNASVLLLDTHSGRIVSSRQVRGTNARQLGAALDEGASAFFNPTAEPVEVAPRPTAPSRPTVIEFHADAEDQLPTAVGSLKVSARAFSPVHLTVIAPDSSRIETEAPYENKAAQPGRWTVTASSRGYQDQTRTFDVGSEDVTRVNLEMVALGGLDIRGEPRDANVRVIGPEAYADEGHLPWEGIGLPSGTYRVTVSREGFVEETRTVTVGAGQVSTLSVQLTKKNEPARMASGNALALPEMPLRARATILGDIQRLEQLFSATPRLDPRAPIIAQRLAENYSELSRYMAREKTLLARERDALRRTDPEKAEERDEEVQKAGSLAEQARLQSERYVRLFPSASTEP